MSKDCLPGVPWTCSKCSGSFNIVESDTCPHCNNKVSIKEIDQSMNPCIFQVRDWKAGIIQTTFKGYKCSIRISGMGTHGIVRDAPQICDTGRCPMYHTWQLMISA